MKLRRIAGDYREIFACFKLDLDRFWKSVFQYFDDLFDEMARLKRYPFAFDPSSERQHLFDKTRASFSAHLKHREQPLSVFVRIFRFQQLDGHEDRRQQVVEVVSYSACQC